MIRKTKFYKTRLFTKSRRRQYVNHLCADYYGVIRAVPTYYQRISQCSHLERSTSELSQDLTPAVPAIKLDNQLHRLFRSTETFENICGIISQTVSGFAALLVIINLTDIVSWIGLSNL